MKEYEFFGSCDGKDTADVVDKLLRGRTRDCQNPAPGSRASQLISILEDHFANPPDKIAAQKELEFLLKQEEGEGSVFGEVVEYCRRGSRIVSKASPVQDEIKIVQVDEDLKKAIEDLQNEKNI